MQTIQMVDLQRQYHKIKPEIDAAIAEIMTSAQFINGPSVKQFAQNLAQYLEVKHVIPCGNGTDALQIALMALDLQPGDEVITCPFTFVATAEVIALLRLKPVFVDANPCTFTINEYQIEQAITPRTKCILPVHLFGQAANMEAIMKIAAKHNLFVIEDNAQAIGADFYFSDGRKQKVGTIGTIGCTSFFPSKNLGAYGDAGAIFTNDDELANKINVICNHGSSVRYYHDEIGVNSRMDTLQAAILDIKLKHLDEYCSARQQVAKFYSEHLGKKSGITVPKVARYSSHVFHQYTMLVENGRDELKKALESAGIPAMIYYPVPLHLQKAYAGDGYKAGDFPVSEELASKVLSLPMHTELDEKTLTFIAETLKKSLS